MPRARARESRFDMRGGVNTSFSQDVLDLTELRAAKNARPFPYGALSKRRSTQRIHDAALGGGAAVKGLFQWHPSAGRQVVAICNGNFYHKLAAATDFTEVASTLSTTRLASFVPYRVGADIVLYFADGALRSWNHATTTLTTTIADAPAAQFIALYKERLYATDGTKRLYGSKLNDPATWAVASGGFFADVETYDAEPLVGLAVDGSSLLVFKQDNVARFTGISNEDIDIDRDTEGVSSEVGLIAANTLLKTEDFVFGLTQKGPYVFTESGIQEITLKVQREIDFANKELWADAFAVLNKDRAEILLMLPATGESSNLTGWLLDLRTRAWMGPWVFPFPAVTLARYEREDGSDAFLIGGNDGRIRDGDVRSLATCKDDVLRNGTGGTAVELYLELPTIIAGDPEREKSLHGRNSLQADLGVDGSIDVEWASERGSGTLAVEGDVGGVKDYPFKLDAVGKRITLGLREATDYATQINGITLDPILRGK